MNTAQLIPPLDEYGLPAPPWLILILSVVTLSLHFIAVGYVLTSTAVMIPLQVKARAGSAEHWLIKRLEAPLPIVLSFAITLGVAPLLFVQVLYQPFFYTSNILIGHQWFGMVPMLIGGFYLIYILIEERLLGWTVPPGLAIVARLAIFGSMLYMLATHTMNATILLGPEAWRALQAAGGNPLAIEDAVLWPKVLHNLGAMFVIGSVWLLALGARSARTAGGDAIQAEGSRRLLKWGAVIGGAAVGAQIVLGLWLFMVERVALGSLMNAMSISVILWGVGILTAIALGAVLLIGGTTGKGGVLLWAGWGLLLLTLVGMFSIREGIRQVRLAEFFQMSQWTIYPQISSLILFLVFFVAGLGLVAMMIKWMLDAFARPVGATES